MKFFQHQKDQVNEWIAAKPSNKPFTDMQILTELFNVSGNNGEEGKQLFAHLDWLIECGFVKSCPGCMNTVYLNRFPLAKREFKVTITKCGGHKRTTKLITATSRDSAKDQIMAQLGENGVLHYCEESGFYD